MQLKSYRFISTIFPIQGSGLYASNYDKILNLNPIVLFFLCWLKLNFYHIYNKSLCTLKAQKPKFLVSLKKKNKFCPHCSTLLNIYLEKKYCNFTYKNATLDHAFWSGLRKPWLSSILFEFFHYTRKITWYLIFFLFLNTKEKKRIMFKKWEIVLWDKWYCVLETSQIVVYSIIQLREYKSTTDDIITDQS